MKRRVLIILLTLFWGAASACFAEDLGIGICYKGECWQEQGLTRLAGKGCPTPTLFVKTSLAELKSYVDGAKKFNLSESQLKKLREIYEHANMVVVRERGQLQSTTILLISEMTKDLPDEKKVDELISEIEDHCWGAVEELAKDVNAARAIVK